MVNVFVPPMVTAAVSLTVRLLMLVSAPSVVFLLDAPFAENVTSVVASGTAPVLVRPFCASVQFEVPLLSVVHVELTPPFQKDGGMALSVSAVPE